MINEINFKLPSEIIKNIGEFIPIDKQAKSPIASLLKTAIRNYEIFAIFDKDLTFSYYVLKKPYKYFIYMEYCVVRVESSLSDGDFPSTLSSTSSF
jgi:hypothetical protein